MELGKNFHVYLAVILNWVFRSLYRHSTRTLKRMSRTINHNFLYSPTVLQTQEEINWTAITLKATSILQKNTFTNKTIKSLFRMSLTPQQHKDSKEKPMKKNKTDFKYRKQNLGFDIFLSVSVSFSFKFMFYISSVFSSSTHFMLSSQDFFSQYASDNFCASVNSLNLQCLYGFEIKSDFFFCVYLLIAQIKVFFKVSVYHLLTAIVLQLQGDFGRIYSELDVV